MEQYRLSPLAAESVVYQQSLNLPRGNNCYSINLEKSSNILAFGCSEVTLIYNSNLQYENHMTFKNFVRSVGQHTKSRKVYYIHPDCRVGYFCLDDFQSSGEVLRLSADNKYPRIAVNDEHLVVSNAEKHLLHADSFSSTTSRPYSPTDDGNGIRSLKFDSDGLITLDVTGLVTKYRIGVRESPQLIWRCPAIKGAYALCVDQSTGLVYVTGPNHILYIISAGVCPFGIIVWCSIAAGIIFSAAVMFLRALITVSSVSFHQYFIFQ